MPDKICPIMSRMLVMINHDGDKYINSQPEFGFIYCQKEKCVAWDAVGGTIKEPVFGCKLIERE